MTLRSLKQAGTLRTPPVASQTARLADVARPVYVGHRGGGALLGPEYTRTNLRTALGYGLQVIECDTQILADGTVAICHDTTVDYMTTGTGNVADYTAQSWKQLTQDSAFMMGYGTWPVEQPLFLSDILTEYGGRVVVMVQVDGFTFPVVDKLVELLKVPKSSIIIQSFSQTPCLAAVAAGYSAVFLTLLDTTPNYATLAAGGVTAICTISTALTAPVVATANAAGLEVWAYTPNSRAERDQLLALGVVGILSDDPIYLADRFTSRTTDAFKANAFMPGHHATRSSRGKFYGSGVWGYDYTASADTDVSRLGYLKPPNPSNYVVNFECNITQVNLAANYGFIALSTTDDFTIADRPAQADAYQFLVRGDGTIGSRVYTDNTFLANLNASQAVTGFALNTWLGYRVTVTPTTIRWERSDGQGTTFSTANATLHRPLPYLHFGRSGGNGAQFRNVVIT